LDNHQHRISQPNRFIGLVLFFLLVLFAAHTFGWWPR
jgi:hypothetical protein